MHCINGLHQQFWDTFLCRVSLAEFHSLFKNIGSEGDYRDNLGNYPHILDFLFYGTIEQFVRHWLYHVLGGEWH